jgi:succinate dehydrogenase / fumarate reductase membrane anchor subunit
MSLRTPLARAKGLGSAKEGVSHWWAQRVTAIALVPLALWFVMSVIGLVGADYGTVSEWLQAPVQSALMVLFLVALFYHAQLGLQVVVEDYVHTEGAKTGLLLGLKFLLVFLAAVAVLSVLRVAFGG